MNRLYLTSVFMMHRAPAYVNAIFQIIISYSSHNMQSLDVEVLLAEENTKTTVYEHIKCHVTDKVIIL